MRTTPTDDEIRFGTERRWKGKRLLTKAEKLAIQRAYMKKWRARNRQKMLDYFREYRAAHPGLKLSQATYYRGHKDKWNARSQSADAKKWRRDHRKKNAARLNAQRREWNRQHPDRAKAIERRSRGKRREQKRIADRLYRQQKPEIYAASIARAKAAKPELYKRIAVKSSLVRRARKKALPVERVSLKSIVERDRDQCHLCSRHVDRCDRSFDHLIPVVRGGAHAEWNLALAHLVCNKRRGTKQILPSENRASAETYINAKRSERAA